MKLKIMLDLGNPHIDDLITMDLFKEELIEYLMTYGCVKKVEISEEEE